MAKKYTFEFNSKDWLADTAEMTDAEARSLIDLICYNHINQTLPSDEERLARQTKRSVEDFRKIWSVIKSKFREVPIANGTPNGVVNGDQVGVPNGGTVGDTECIRLVNKKLSKVLEANSSKIRKNKLIGTFAYVLNKMNLNKKEASELKNRFNVDELLAESDSWTTEQLTEWCENAIANGTPNGVVNGDQVGVPSVKNGLYINNNIYNRDNILYTNTINKRKKSKIEKNEEIDFFKDFTDEEKLIWEDFVSWKKQNNFSRVDQMKKPLQPKELITLIRKNVSAKLIKEKYKAMENTADLLKKYVSAYLTLADWIRRAQGNGQ